MKQIKNILCLLLIMPVLLIQSCVKDQNYVFDEQSSVRAQQLVEEVNAILKNSSEGWFLDYYPGTGPNYPGSIVTFPMVAGYAMYLDFNSDGTVAVSCEIETYVPARQVETSDFDVFVEKGAILAFSSFNNVMHYFSNATPSNYTGRLGDYEFIVMKVEQDKITLKGKKHGNRAVLRRNVANTNSDTYLSDVIDFSDLMSSYPAFGLVLNGNRIGSAPVIDRYFELNYTERGEDLTRRLWYTFTPNGVRLYEPFVFNGVTMENFEWDATNEKYICTDAGVDAYLDQYYPPDFELRFEEILGQWEIQYHGSSTTVWRTDTVEFVQKKKNALFSMVCDKMFSFPGNGFDVKYNATKGTIAIHSHHPTQVVVSDVTYNIRICLHDRGAGYVYLTLDRDPALKGVWNNDEGGERKINFVDNGVWGTYRANGLLLRRYTLDGGSYINLSTTTTPPSPIGDRFGDITITKIN